MENNTDSRMMVIPEGTVILKEGEYNLDMYKILKGHAEIYTGYGTDREVLVGIIGPQACFGEFGLLLKGPAIYTVVAYSDVYVIRITEGDLGDFVQQNHKNIIDIMRNMSYMMMQMQQQIEMLMNEVKEYGSLDENLLRQMHGNLRNYAVNVKPGTVGFNASKMHFFDPENRRG